MMTFSEARSRAAVNRARIVRTIYGNEFRVSLNEWTTHELDRKAYFTNCLDDAVITAGAMRREADRKALALRP